jgi:hypothetical protein
MSASLHTWFFCFCSMGMEARHAVGGRVLHPAEAVADDAGVVQLHDRAALPRVVVDAAEPEGALRFLVVDLH